MSDNICRLAYLVNPLLYIQKVHHVVYEQAKIIIVPVHEVTFQYFIYLMNSQVLIVYSK